MKKTFLDYFNDIIEFYAQNGMDFGEDIPKLVLDDSKAFRFDPFIPTGHYDWTENTITLMIDNRHVKDILRTLCHELIHAWQYKSNPDAYINSDKSGLLEENPVLLKYEEEAYLKGNVMFRKWTESVHGR